VTLSIRYVAAWIAAYAVLAVLPLGVALVAPPVPASRGFGTEFGVGLGFIGLAMLGLQFALTARFRRIAAAFGHDTMLQFHRQAGISAYLLVLAHPAVLVLVEPGYLAFLDPRSSVSRALALWAVLGALTLLLVLTLWRERLHISYEWWRLTHAVLAAFVLFVGVVHVLRVGHYVSTPLKTALWTAMSGLAMLLLIEQRIFRPARLRRRPWRVTGVRPELGDAWTLTLEPDGHAGFVFRPGQFVWLTLGGSPFALQQHPFSIASDAAAAPRLELTIRALGDFTSRVGTVPVGTRAFLEGPFGAFTLGPDAPAAAFVVGGVGITPVMSMLRTLHGAGDPRRLLLIYGNIEERRILFRQELDALAAGLDLRIVHVLERPPAGWTGAVGRIDAALLQRELDAFEAAGAEYFVCGPEPMMDVVETFLLSRGVRVGRIHSERFDIV
jgi:predicted ferric reductase